MICCPSLKHRQFFPVTTARRHRKLQMEQTASEAIWRVAANVFGKQLQAKRQGVVFWLGGRSRS
jgi:hypothetical protein